MKRLANKVAVITGGSSGIGLAAAKEFISKGAKVVIFARGREELANAVKELGPNGNAIQGNVANIKDLERLFKDTEQHFGKADELQ